MSCPTPRRALFVIGCVAPLQWRRRRRRRRYQAFYCSSIQRRREHLIAAKETSTFEREIDTILESTKHEKWSLAPSNDGDNALKNNDLLGSSSSTNTTKTPTKIHGLSGFLGVGTSQRSGSDSRRLAVSRYSPTFVWLCPFPPGHFGFSQWNAVYEHSRRASMCHSHPKNLRVATTHPNPKLASKLRTLCGRLFLRRTLSATTPTTTTASSSTDRHAGNEGDTVGTINVSAWIVTGYLLSRLIDSYTDGAFWSSEDGRRCPHGASGPSRWFEWCVGSVITSVLGGDSSLACYRL